MTQDPAVQFPKALPFFHRAELRLETVKEKIKELIDIHLYMDIDRLQFEVQDRAGQFLRKYSLLIPQLKTTKKDLKMMEEVL